jgi:hypothetical protein
MAFRQTQQLFPFMKSLRLLTLALFALPLLVPAGLRAEAGPADAIIAKARAYVGSEAALKGLKSVHFIGSLDDETNGKVSIDIIFQSPFRQRIVLTRSAVGDKPGAIETTGLDDYEGWRRVQETGEKGRSMLTIFDTPQVRRLRANVWENLHYYSGIEKKGGTVSYLGQTTLTGKSAVKVAFVHDPTITFTRYFDSDTGKLLLTETESGSSIREEGEVIVAGLRFPKKLINTQNGRIAVINLDQVKINETFGPELFEVPMLKESDR